MRLLVTAGNTQVQIDRVRSITNIFTGRTGGRIALTAHAHGHDVLLLTSHPEVLGEHCPNLPADQNWQLERYRTFDELEGLLDKYVRTGGFDAIIHELRPMERTPIVEWRPPTPSKALAGQRDKQHKKRSLGHCELRVAARQQIQRKEQSKLPE